MCCSADEDDVYGVWSGSGAGKKICVKRRNYVTLSLCVCLSFSLSLSLNFSALLSVFF